MTNYSYDYITKYTAASDMYMQGRQGRTVQSITIHHWGKSHNLDFLGIVRFLCSSRPANPTSANYVTQGRDKNGKIARKVACIVDPDDTAYHCGDWFGNTTSIGIECRPYPTDADYQVYGALVYRLRSVYGNVPLHPHKYWSPTECPGAISLSKIEHYAHKSTNPLLKDDTETNIMALSKNDISKIAQEVANQLRSPMPTRWEELNGKPNPKKDLSIQYLTTSTNNLAYNNSVALSAVLKTLKKSDDSSDISDALNNIAGAISERPNE